MELKELLKMRRSTRKFSDKIVPDEVVDRILESAFTAPSSRNSRSTRIMVVREPATLAAMSEMRDYGSAFLKGAPLAFVVAGDTSATDLWRENCSILATILQLACVDEGLASCWVHVDGRPQRQSEPQGPQAVDHLRSLLPLPGDWEVLCVVAAGYSDFHPAALPPFDWHDSVVKL